MNIIENGITRPMTMADLPKLEAALVAAIPGQGDASGRSSSGAMVGLPALSSNQADILAHTSRTGRYVSDEEPDLITLAQRGLLRDHGAQSLAGGMHYYTPTPEGRAALNAHRQSARPIPRQPEPNMNPTTSNQTPEQPAATASRTDIGVGCSGGLGSVIQRWESVLARMEEYTLTEYEKGARTGIRTCIKDLKAAMTNDALPVLPNTQLSNSGQP